MSKKLFIGYTIFLLFVSVFSYLFIDPNIQYFELLYNGFAYTNRPIVTAVYIVLISIFFAFYLHVVLNESKKGANLSMFKKLVITTGIFLIFSYPAMLSYDVFNYIATAKTTFFYKENPYIVMPIEFAGDPLLQFTRAANKFALYGPTWILLTGIPWLLGFGNFIIILFNIKLLILCFYFGTAALLYKMSDYKITPILFALNPLVIIETLVSSHNDIVMVFLILASYYCLKKKYKTYGLLLFFLSVFVKFGTVVLLPLIVLIIWRHVHNRNINWDTVYSFSALLLFLVFLLSPIREELYPWYFIWVLPFVYLKPENKKIVQFSIAFSFGLLLRYVPYMYYGTYSGVTPIVRNVLMLIPLVMYALFSYREKPWLKS